MASSRISNGFFSAECWVFFILFLTLLFYTKDIITSESDPSKIRFIVTAVFPKNHQFDVQAALNNLQEPGSSPDDGPFKKRDGPFKNRAEIGKEQGNGCDIFDGRWVEVKDSGTSYEPGSCPYIDEGGGSRRDASYQGKKVLEMLRGKKVAFVGDSINRNMWESLICILRNSLEDKSRVYEISGRKEFKSDKHYSFIFIDYNCTIDFFWSTFLVHEQKVLGVNGTEKETLKLDVIDECSPEYKDADVIIFNTGHWWTHTKTSLGKDYYQEGDRVYDQLNADEALEKAMRTWARYVDAHIDANRTRIFFRGYSSSHFGGGKWNRGGNCDGETLPVTDEAQLVKAPKLVEVVESVIMEMTHPVVYLNVTRMTDYRKDAHPATYRGRAERGKLDCSHWCLPGVPDVWNDMLWAMCLKGAEKMMR